MSALVLFHVVLSCESFMADWAVHALLPRMFLAMPSSVARGREGGMAVVGRRIWTWILVLLACRIRRGAAGGSATGRGARVEVGTRDFRG